MEFRSAAVRMRSVRPAVRFVIKHGMGEIELAVLDHLENLYIAPIFPRVLFGSVPIILAHCCPTRLPHGCLSCCPKPCCTWLSVEGKRCVVAAIPVVQ